MAFCLARLAESKFARRTGQTRLFSCREKSSNFFLESSFRMQRWPEDSGARAFCRMVLATTSSTEEARHAPPYPSYPRRARRDRVPPPSARDHHRHSRRAQAPQVDDLPRAVAQHVRQGLCRRVLPGIDRPEALRAAAPRLPQARGPRRPGRPLPRRLEDPRRAVVARADRGAPAPGGRPGRQRQHRLPRHLLGAPRRKAGRQEGRMQAPPQGPQAQGRQGGAAGQDQGEPRDIRAPGGRRL